MATRFYLQNATAPYQPATYRGSWDATGNAVSSKLGVTKAGASNLNTVAETSTTNSWDVLLVRFVSDPIAATSFTTSDTVQWVAGVTESSNNLNGFYHVHIYVTTGDSDTVRGTLLNNSIGATEWTTTATGRGEGTKSLANNVSALAGDRIVVEVGYQAVNTSSVSMSGTLYFGATGGTDLAQASTAVTTNPGWVEFSTTITTLTTIAPSSSTATSAANAPVLEIPSVNQFSFQRRGTPFRALANPAGSWGFDYPRAGAPGPLTKRTSLSLDSTATPGASTATASASVPTTLLLLEPPAATATADAPAPVAGTFTTVSATLATATANTALPTPLASSSVAPDQSTASATAPAPSLVITSLLVLTTATATGAAPTPSTSATTDSVGSWGFDYARRGQPLRAIGTNATARTFEFARRTSPHRALTGTNGAAVVTIGGTIAQATSAALAPTPFASSTVSPGASTASASAPVPTMGAGSTVSPPVATATAESYAFFALPTVVVAEVATATMRMVGTYSGSVYGDVEPDGTGPWAATGPSVVPVATATGTALAIDNTREIAPITVTATAAALAPAITQLIGLELAYATAEMPDVEVVVALTPPVSTATANTATPTVVVAILPNAATATGDGAQPTPVGISSATVTPDVAAATAAAPIPNIPLQVPVSTAAGAAFATTLTNDYVVIVPAPIQLVPLVLSAWAIGQGNIPGIRIILTPTTSTASADALVPSLSRGVSPAAATATGTAPVPIPTTTLAIPEATATAQARTPSILGVTTLLAVPASTAAATAPAPNSSVVSTAQPGAATATGAAGIPSVAYTHDQTTGAASASGSASAPSFVIFSTIPAPVSTADARAYFGQVNPKQRTVVVISAGRPRIVVSSVASHRGATVESELPEPAVAVSSAVRK